MARKKLTIALSEELHDDISSRAQRRGMTITDLIRGALKLDFFVEDNNASLVVEKDGQRTHVMLR